VNQRTITFAKKKEKMVAKKEVRGGEEYKTKKNLKEKAGYGG